MITEMYKLENTLAPESPPTEFSCATRGLDASTFPPTSSARVDVATTTQGFVKVARIAGLISIVVLMHASPGWAQDPPGQPPIPQDSLDILIRDLHRRVDSLVRVLAEMRAAEADTTEALDELAALRAAAQQAAEDAAEERPEEGQEQQSRTRNLSILNPEVSVTGDIVGSYLAPAGGDDQLVFIPREFEFSFQAALDPYTRMRVFITREEELAIAGLEPAEGAEEETGLGFEIEEGYIQWVGLPGATGIKFGKFRQELGLYNRWHTHALLEVDRPLVTTTFLGDDGLIQTGLSVSFPNVTVGPTTNTLFFELTTGTNEVLFDGGNDLSFLGRFQNFWDLGANAYFQLGASGVYGRKTYRKAVTLAGIPWVTWHELRHTFASRLAMRGVPLGTIAALLRHSTTALVKRYAHLSPAYLKGAVEEVSAFGREQRSETEAQSVRSETAVIPDGTVTETVTEERTEEGSRA